MASPLALVVRVVLGSRAPARPLRRPAPCTKSAKKKFPSRRHVYETSDFSPEVSTDQRVYHVYNFGKIAGRRVYETV